MDAVVLGPPLIERRVLADVAGRWLINLALDGPVLVFEEHDQAAAQCIRSRMQEERARWPKARDETQRRDIARRLRKFHRALVNDSIGVTWPGCTAFGRRFVYTWADELAPSQRGALRKLVAQLDRRRQSA